MKEVVVTCPFTADDGRLVEHSYLQLTGNLTEPPINLSDQSPAGWGCNQ